MIKKNKIKKIFIILALLVLLLPKAVFAENESFTIQMPENYTVNQFPTGSIRLVAIRNDEKVNFTISKANTYMYYEYSQIGLKNIVNALTSKMKEDYKLGKIKSEISAINMYPCYEISYKMTVKKHNKDMYIRQFIIFEDTYTYMIMLGGASEEALNDSSVQEALNTFYLNSYQRNKVEKVAEKRKSSFRIGDLSFDLIFKIGGVVITIIIILVRKRRKNPNLDKDELY